VGVSQKQQRPRRNRTCLGLDVLPVVEGVDEEGAAGDAAQRHALDGLLEGLRLPVAAGEEWWWFQTRRAVRESDGSLNPVSCRHLASVALSPYHLLNRGPPVVPVALLPSQHAAALLIARLLAPQADAVPLVLAVAHIGVCLFTVAVRIPLLLVRRRCCFAGPCFGGCRLDACSGRGARPLGGSGAAVFAAAGVGGLV
jgi:hypothetical protein